MFGTRQAQPRYLRPFISMEYRSQFQRDPETMSREQSKEQVWDQADRDWHRPKTDSKRSKTRVFSREHQPFGDWSEHRSNQERGERAAELAEQERRERAAEAARKRYSPRDGEDGEPQCPKVQERQRSRFFRSQQRQRTGLLSAACTPGSREPLTKVQICFPRTC